MRTEARSGQLIGCLKDKIVDTFRDLTVRVFVTFMDLSRLGARAARFRNKIWSVQAKLDELKRPGLSIELRPECRNTEDASSISLIYMFFFTKEFLNDTFFQVACIRETLVEAMKLSNKLVAIDILSRLPVSQ